ncbi:hypothetical protein LWI29_017567 [Acer saccharum]|uniref:Uncharacterized protein n=1 Tax=Acer saccharum TaxID=4024 RepID=A0AA39TH67_ACESA|nr:hypothetical protein LWI29_017567 [Acer saccharum]
MAANLLCALLQEEEGEDDDDDDDDYANLLAIVALEEEQHANTGQSSHRRDHAVIQHYRVQSHERLYHDYFSESLIYPEHLFRRRFRMHHPFFLHILSAVEAYNSYFVQRQNVTRTVGLSSLQKMTATMRMLAYGVSAYSVDDYVQIGESTAIESIKMFTNDVVAIFGDEYLRSLNNEDTTRLQGYLALGRALSSPFFGRATWRYLFVAAIDGF